MTHTMKKIALGLTAAAIAMGGIAYAQGGKGQFRGMDADGDGVVTRAEAQATAVKMFEKLDVNNDGKIDAADREARMTERRTERFEELDTNKDGSISKAEFMAGKSRMGGDGPMAGGGPRGNRGPGMDGPPPADCPGMAGGPGMGRPGPGGKPGMGHGHQRPGMMIFQMADTNNDGAVTKEEAMTAAMKHFDMVDTNKDGKISTEERQAAREKMRAQFQSRQAPPADTAN